MNRICSARAISRNQIAAFILGAFASASGVVFAQQGYPSTGAPAEVYGSVGVSSGRAYLAEGNPFWRQGRPRATLLGGSHTASSAPAGPNLGLGTMTPVPTPIPVAVQTLPIAPAYPEAGHMAAVPSTIVPPNPVLPNVVAPPVNNALASTTPVYEQQPPVAEVPSPAAVAPPVAQPELHGTAILIQRSADGNPVAPVIAWGEDALRQMEGLRDYTCTFKKREVVDGKLLDQQTMFVKSRPAPLSVYMYFLDQDVRGQEAIYVEGRNNGHIVAHPVGFKQTLVGTLSLAPNDSQAMDGNRYPITSFGIKNLLGRYLKGMYSDMQTGETEVRIIEKARVNDRVCTCIQVSHPTKRPEFVYSMTRLYVDDELNVPIRYEGYDWPRRPGEGPPLAEEYTYANMKLNVGLTDADFDPRNPQYGYK
ncbi:MAG: hypothetical protein C0483_23385 [Pirellula sp.]|nr:hypothetical protein [Pirellula sp.]